MSEQSTRRSHVRPLRGRSGTICFYELFFSSLISMPIFQRSVDQLPSILRFQGRCVRQAGIDFSSAIPRMAV